MYFKVIYKVAGWSDIFTCYVIANEMDDAAKYIRNEVNSPLALLLVKKVSSADSSHWDDIR